MPDLVTREMAIAALDCGITPLLMLGPANRIVHVNSAARSLLAAGRAFQLVGGALQVQRQSDREKLEAALASARRNGERAIVHFGNRQGDVNYVITIGPLPGGTALLLAIAELRMPLFLRKNWSAEALALPAAYSELAEGLAAGENLTEFAERTGLTIGGSRTRLKKLLKRLAVRSQSDLIALLLRAAATLSVR